MSKIEQASQSVNEWVSLGYDLHAAILEAADEFGVAREDLMIEWDLMDDVRDDSMGVHGQDEYDGQPDEYTEWQDYYGGDDWDHGQYDEY